MKKLLAGFTPFLFLLLFSIGLNSAPVPLETAKKAAEGWLSLGRNRLGANMGESIASIQPIKGKAGETLFYVASLTPEGYIVFSSDDLVEPVIAFSHNGEYPSNPKNTLNVLLFKDTQNRLAKAIEFEKSGVTFTKGSSMETAKNAWSKLLDDSKQATKGVDISDVWVAPLIQSEWGQTSIVNKTRACYNYYTPTSSTKWVEGSVTNYPCGCAATMMAQVMRYFEYPTTKPTGGPFSITVDTQNQQRTLRGGTGINGAYDWAKMPYTPGSTTTQNQLMEIGALCYDAGISVKMDYAPDGSGALMKDAKTAMISTFSYTNAVIYQSEDLSSITNNGLNDMVNPNLDAGRPTMLGVNNKGADGHAIVCDGYGYDSGYVFHHLNMGWEGSGNTWYLLPIIGMMFDTVDACIYNIYENGTGEIISGRVATDAGFAGVGKKITIEYTQDGSQKSKIAYSSSTGIYYFDKIPSNISYTVTCEKSVTPPITVATSKSVDNKTVGNKWGINFVIEGGPIITTSTKSLTPTCAVGQNAPSDVFQLWNSGIGSFQPTFGTNVTWMTSINAVLRPDGKLDVFVGYTTNNLPAGTYKGLIQILSNEAVNSPYYIEVVLTVSAQTITTSTTTISAGAEEGGSPPPQTFQIWNSGAGILSFAVSEDANWLSCAPGTGTSTGQGDKKTITVTFNTSGLLKGVHQATIMVSSTDGLASSKLITVTVYVGPNISVYPTSINVIAAWGSDAAAQYFDVWNSGGGTLNFSVTDSVPWLSCTPPGGSSTGSTDKKRIKILFGTAGLAEGNYTGTITIAAGDAINNPQTISVSLSIVVKPGIALSTNALLPTCTLGENAAPGQFTVSNNNNNSILNYVISKNVEWLSCSPTSGDSTAVADKDTITVTYSTSEMAVGTYKGIITVADPNAINSPQTVDVTLEVGPNANDLPQTDLAVSLLSNTGGITRDYSNKVSNWPDFSTNGNNAWQMKKAKQPLISNVLQGSPTLSFFGKNYLEITSSPEINSGGPYTEKTVVMYFRTGNDVVARQTIFTIGDKFRGMNAYIDAGNVYINAWNLTDNDGADPATPWGPIYASTPVDANTAYTFVYTFDQASNTIKGYLNGTSFTGKGVEKLYATTVNSTIGGVCKTTCFHDGKTKTAAFTGKIAGFVHYNRVLSDLERTSLENYMTATFMASFTPVDDFVLWLENSEGLEKNETKGLTKWLDRSTSLGIFSQSGKNNIPVWYENVVNLQPGILFDGADDYMMSKSNPQINASKTPYTEKMMFIVFQTGADVAQRQVIWSQGDKNTGLSAYINGGNIYLCAWDLKGTKTSAAWGPVNVSGPIAANTPYCLQMTFDQPNNKFEGFLDGISFGSVAGIGTLAKHKPAVIGAIKGTTQFNDQPGSTGSYYSGYIFEILMYNQVLNAGNIATIETYLNGKYGIIFN